MITCVLSVADEGKMLLIFIMFCYAKGLDTSYIRITMYPFLFCISHLSMLHKFHWQQPNRFIIRYDFHPPAEINESKRHMF